MNLRLPLLALLVSLWPLGAAAQQLSAQPSASAQDDERLDSQLWPDTQVAIRLRPNLSLVLFGTARLGRDDSALISEQVGIGFNRRLGKH